MSFFGRVLTMAALWMALMVSSLVVVLVTYQTRLATHQLELLRHQATDLQVESGQLLLEKSSLTAFAIIERKALAEFNMVVPELDQIVIVKP